MPTGYVTVGELPTRHKRSTVWELILKTFRSMEDFLLEDKFSSPYEPLGEVPTWGGGIDFKNLEVQKLICEDILFSSPVGELI